jgi:K(+)-stimulated pyrophosphate-energized sodium pump
MYGLVIIGIVAALSFAAINFYGVKRLDPGTELMQEIAGAIQEGADAFIRHEYKVIFSIAISSPSASAYW